MDRKSYSRTKSTFTVMKIHVSLRIYWLILSAVFTLFALLVWFWLIPYGILEYNLAVNLFTSSIFTVLTIIFLNWLFIVREENEWKTVKDKVYSMVQGELGLLFDEILGYIENGLMLKISLLSLDKKTRKGASFSELCELKDTKELKLNTEELKLFLEGKTPETFSDVAQNLSNIELKYSRFLPSQLALSLLRIQDSIRMLETIAELHIKIEGLNPTLRAIMLKPLQAMENEIPKIVSASFKILIEEIHKIHGMGIEFSPYP